MKKNDQLLTACLVNKLFKSSMFGDGKKISEVDTDKVMDDWYRQDHGDKEVLAHYYVPYSGWHYFVVGAELTQDVGWIFMCCRVLDGVNDWFCCPLTYFIKLGSTPINYNKTLGMKLEECNGENLEFYMERYLSDSLY